MNAGKLRHRIVLDEPIVTPDDAGGEIVDWRPFYRVWASVEPLKGREQLLSEQILAEMDTRIRIRWSPSVDAITAQWRARHQNVIYNFKSVARVDYGRREIEIMAASGTNDG